MILAPFYNFLESCKPLLGVIEFSWLHFSPKRCYKVQIDVFVLQKYKNILKIFDFRLVAIIFLSRITLFSCQFWILQKVIVSKFSLLSCLVSGTVIYFHIGLGSGVGTVTSVVLECQRCQFCYSCMSYREKDYPAFQRMTNPRMSFQRIHYEKTANIHF